MDELPEFGRGAIETLRIVMEEGRVEIARAKSRLSLPAKCLVLAAMNPCPCGYAGDTSQVCRCTPYTRDRYVAKVSGPLLDRFDLFLRLSPIKLTELSNKITSKPRSHEDSASVRARVEKARAVLDGQREQMGNGLELGELLQRTDSTARTVLDQLETQAKLSARGYRSLLRVALTIAAFDGSERIAGHDIAEAYFLRSHNFEEKIQNILPETTYESSGYEDARLTKKKTQRLMKSRKGKLSG